MGSEWFKTTIGDLLKSRGGEIKTGPFGTKLKASEYSTYGVPVISVGEVQLGRLVLHDRTPRVSSEITDKMPEYLLREGDIVFGRKGAVERSARVKPEQDGWFLGSDGIRLRLPSCCDTSFIAYQFLTKAHKQWMVQHAAGTTMASLNEKIIRLVPLVIPSKNEQKAIAHILGSLDDKIELNSQMNTTLELMAQALFKSWFVDFDPVIDNALAAGNPIPEPLHARAETRKALGDKRKPLPVAIQKHFPSCFVFSEEMGWLPEGWEVARLGKYITVKRGGSPRPIHDFLVDNGLPWVKISDASASVSRFLMGTRQFIKSEGLKKTIMLKRGELILSNSATPGLPKFLNLDACVHDGWLYFPEKKVFGDLYLYQLFLVVRSELLMQGNGSVFTNLKTDILKDHVVVVPGNMLMEEIETRLKTLHEKSLAIQMENQSLTKLRDTLLPKLLSGKLRVPDAEKLMAEAL